MKQGPDVGALQVQGSWR